MAMSVSSRCALRTRERHFIFILSFAVGTLGSVSVGIEMKNACVTAMEQDAGVGAPSKSASCSPLRKETLESFLVSASRLRQSLGDLPCLLPCQGF